MFTTVEAVVRRYRQDDLPLDVVHIDIHYLNEYRVFTWDPKRFPDPRALMSRLKAQGVKVITIVDPGIKYQPPANDAKQPLTPSHPELGSQDKSYYVYNQGIEKNYFQKRKDGKLFIGRVWPAMPNHTRITVGTMEEMAKFQKALLKVMA